MYKEELKQAGETELSLSDTTLYELLRVCEAKQRKASNCVDYYLADALDVRTYSYF